jgi:dTMP kinase
MRTGRLYVFEGPDGVGKSTLAAKLADQLRADGVVTHLLAFPGQEDGSLGRFVWEFHHAPSKFGVASVDPTSLQLLHLAAHVDAIERRIRPALRAGETIVLDRFWWSTLIYGVKQGASHVSVQAMIDLERLHWGEILPDMIFVISREQPFQNEVSQDRFLELKRAYMEIAAVTANATVIENITTVSAAVEQILHAISARAGEQT